MLRKLLRAKIHQPRVTQCDPDYVGSLTVDADLLRAAGIRPNEAVHVFDIDNAARFETYIIRGEPGTGVIGVNGAAAKLVEPGHKLIVIAFGLLTEAELDDHHAKVVVCDAHNRVADLLDYASTIDAPVTEHTG